MCLPPQLFPDIVSVFGTEVKAKPKAGEGGAAGAGDGEKKKIEVIAFVEPGKARNMGIALSKFNRLGFPAVIKAVMSMDDAPLGGLEGIATLLGNMPDEKEVTVDARVLAMCATAPHVAGAKSRPASCSLLFSNALFSLRRASPIWGKLV